MTNVTYNIILRPKQAVAVGTAWWGRGFWTLQHKTHTKCNTKELGNDES